MKRFLIGCLLSFMLITLTKKLQAFESNSKGKATWELGIGIGALNIADYPGSDEESAYVVPLPYFVYKSDLIKADRKGIRSLLWQHNNFELDISAKMSLPVDSDNNKARQDMPDLNPLFELGPSLNYHFYTSADNTTKLSFQMPVRSVTEFNDWELSHQGWVINPAIEYNFEQEEWKMGVKLGVVFANASYNQYFYDVKQAYVTDDRNYFESEKGITAYKLTTTISKRFKHWYLGAFIDYNDLHDSVNINSPLIKSKSNLNSGFFFAWVFKQN